MALKGLQHWAAVIGTMCKAASGDSAACVHEYFGHTSTMLDSLVSPSDAPSQPCQPPGLSRSREDGLSSTLYGTCPVADMAAHLHGRPHLAVTCLQGIVAYCTVTINDTCGRVAADNLHRHHVQWVRMSAALGGCGKRRCMVWGRYMV